MLKQATLPQEPRSKKPSSLQRREALRRREAIQGYLLVSPWIVGFLVFTLFPFLASFVLSLTKYRPYPEFVGFQNYVKAFVQDPRFWGSLKRSFMYGAMSVPLGIMGSLLCALLLNQQMKGRSIYRTLYYLPSLTPIVASSMLWIWIFQPDFGVMNYLLSKVGIDGPGWLSSIEWALPSLVIMSLWGTVGGDRMIIFLAGLQGVPEELFDAVKIDGANTWQRFWYVTLPMISPTMFFNLVLGVIGALKVFAPAYIATGGGPAYSTWFYVLHLYQQAFVYSNMGYASALAWIFFVIVLAFTWIQVKLSGKWVYYAAEVR